jgi:hypothetical protein
MPEDDKSTTGAAGDAAENQQQQTTETPKTFSQEEVNRLLAEEKRNAQKQLKELKGKADEWDKLQEASKSELEKLTGERDLHKSEASAAKLEAAKVRALARAGADPEKIDALLKRVVGSTPEEIEADVKELSDLGLIMPKSSTAATGAGNNGLPPKQQEKTSEELLKEELAKGVNADPLRIIHLRGLLRSKT